MSEELEPVLNLDHIAKGNNNQGTSKFAHQNQDDDMSEELDAVLNVDDLDQAGVKKHEQSKFKQDVELEESDSEQENEENQVQK